MIAIMDCTIASLVFDLRGNIYWTNFLAYWKNEKRQNREKEDSEFLNEQIKNCKKQLAKVKVE
jgi:hypothetical protein